jgi:hypothetical protein
MLLNNYCILKWIGIYVISRLSEANSSLKALNSSYFLIAASSLTSTTLLFGSFAFYSAAILLYSSKGFYGMTCLILSKTAISYFP